MKKFLKIAAGIFVLLMLIGFFLDKDKTARDPTAANSASSTISNVTTSDSTKAPTPRERMQSLMPPAQVALIESVESARRQYAAGANDMAKGAARPARAQSICRALNVLMVDGWVGRVKTLSTNSDGKGVLAVEMGSRFNVKTWNNALSDIVDQTLIEPSTQLFSYASSLRQGLIVRFSATFFRNETDCIEESSFSLSGSIREPDFVFRFTSIAAVD